MKQKAGWTFLALSFTAGLVAYSVRSVRADQTVEVQVASPLYRDLNILVTSNGKVTPIKDDPVRAAFSGMVQEILVKVGDKVSPGQLLIQMYDPYAPSRYASARSALQGAEVSDANLRQGGSQEDRINMDADLKRAEMEVADAQKQVSVLRELATTGAASEGEVSSASHRLEMALTSLEVQRRRMSQRYSKTELTSSEGRLADAKASLQTAKAVLANANMTSAIAGTVYALPVSRFDFVAMGADLVRVADLNKLQVRAFVDEPEIGQLALDQPVSVTWEAKPNRVWHGHVMQIPLSVTSMGTRNVGECVISVDDANGTLLPNTNVTVRITTDHRAHAEVIPREALQMDGPRSFVYRVIDGKLVTTDVRTGIFNLNEAQIVSGLSEHDVVALHSIQPHELHDGLRVKAVQ